MNVAAPTPAPRFTLAAAHCAVCGRQGVTIVTMWGQDRHAYERCWCGFDCAKVDGFPWLKSEERAPPKRRRVRSRA